MKRILTICMVLFAVVAMAQVPVVNHTFANDTLTNTETIYFAYPKAIDKLNNNVAFAFTATEVSGAATIIVTLQEAIQSGKWIDVQADTIVTAGSPNEAPYIFKLTSTPSLFYRVKVAQTGTAVTKMLGSKFIVK